MLLPLGFIMIVKAQETASLNAAITKKAGCAARVFRKHEVCFGQYGARSGGEVTRVAKGCGYYPEPGGSRRHGKNAPGAG